MNQSWKARNPLLAASAILVLLSGLVFNTFASAGSYSVVYQPYAAKTFALLPEDVRYPEGIAIDPETGDIFVSTFDFGPNENQLLRYSKRRTLEARLSFGGTPLLGLAFNSMDGKVYIANFGAGQIQRIAPDFSSTSEVEVVATLPKIGAPENRTIGNPDASEDRIEFGSNEVAAPNAMLFSANGTLYVSDSFQGAIFSLANAESCSGTCEPQLLIHDPLLATAGFPPFGANGLALSADESTLYVANTGDDRVLAVTLATAEIAVFAESLDGADGLAFDDSGTLWVAANQADQILGLDEKGRVIAKLAGHTRVKKVGVDGLLFPASLAISGNKMYVTNAGLALTDAEGDEPEEEVTRFSIARIRLPRL